MREIAKIVVILITGGVLSLFGLVTLVWITTITVRAIKSLYNRIFGNHLKQVAEIKKMLAEGEKSLQTGEATLRKLAGRNYTGC